MTEISKENLIVIYWHDANYSDTEWMPLRQHTQLFQEQAEQIKKKIGVVFKNMDYIKLVTDYIQEEFIDERVKG